MVTTALNYGELTQGSFDITIGPLVDLWQINSGTEYVPGAFQRAQRLALVNYRNVEIDVEEKTIYLPQPGMKLDLGGVAKGYAVDRALAVLDEWGVTAAMVDAGGDLAVLGRRTDGNPFRIGIRHPRNSREYVAVVPVAGRASIVSSGDYERFFYKDGVRYHHIFDPTTGLPACRGVVSATVLGPTAMEGDILSTAVFVLGVEEGLALVESLEGFEALVVTEELEVLKTTGMEVM